MNKSYRTIIQFILRFLKGYATSPVTQHLWELVRIHTGGIAHEHTERVCRAGEAPAPTVFRSDYVGGSVRKGKDKAMSTNMKTRMYIRTLTATAVLSALSCVLMYLEFSVPFVPAFLKMDLSDLPALIASFAYGPVAGVVVALIKNLVHLPFTTTGGAGELANFLLCACFVIPAGWVYRFCKGKKGALIGSLCGTLLMALVSLPVNYYITYPIYATFIPMEAILDMYRAIIPAVTDLWSALLIVNLPFNLVKGLVCVGITFVVYKKISPLLHGVKK